MSDLNTNQQKVRDLCNAARCYLFANPQSTPTNSWPFSKEEWQPGSQAGNLMRALLYLSEAYSLVNDYSITDTTTYALVAEEDRNNWREEALQKEEDLKVYRDNERIYLKTVEELKQQIEKLTEKKNDLSKTLTGLEIDHEKLQERYADLEKRNAELKKAYQQRKYATFAACYGAPNELKLAQKIHSNSRLTKEEATNLARAIYAEPSAVDPWGGKSDEVIMEFKVSKHVDPELIQQQIEEYSKLAAATANGPKFKEHDRVIAKAKTYAKAGKITKYMGASYGHPHAYCVLLDGERTTVGFTEDMLFEEKTHKIVHDHDTAGNQTAIRVERIVDHGEPGFVSVPECVEGPRCLHFWPIKQKYNHVSGYDELQNDIGYLVNKFGLGSHIPYEQFTLADLTIIKRLIGKTTAALEFDESGVKSIKVYDRVCEAIKAAADPTQGHYTDQHQTPYGPYKHLMLKFGHKNFVRFDRMNPADLAAVIAIRQEHDEDYNDAWDHFTKNFKEGPEGRTLIDVNAKDRTITWHFPYNTDPRTEPWDTVKTWTEGRTGVWLNEILRHFVAVSG